MHILLTDILSCPVCGPEHGLILRADRMTERRVEEGALGCPNCERTFPIRDGVALLDPSTTGTGSTADAARTGTDDDAEAVRMAALLGLHEAGGFALIVGPAARLASRVAGLAEGVEIAADREYSSAGPGVSRLAMGRILPFHAGRLRAIWLSGPAPAVLLGEAVRTLHATGRLVLEPAPPDAVQRLQNSGARVLVQQDDTVVAARV